MGMKENMESIVSDLGESQGKLKSDALEMDGTSELALSLAKEGLADIKELSAKITILSDAIQKTSSNMEQMGQLTNMIEGFAGVIAGISNKTNMLALNASIEAARAGEHGRGFAVVAKQVGDLAAQSAKSSKEIKETIQSVQAFNSEMGESLSGLVAVVGEQNEVNDSVGEIFQKILETTLSANELTKRMEQEMLHQKELMSNVKDIIDSFSEE